MTFMGNQTFGWLAMTNIVLMLAMTKAVNGDG